ncbi:MAG: hypothetical protein KKF33_07895 [Alphaproteobacteria bacterium]|nr:hypothetical protein [Alphaproteobacteria bacterium]
MILKAEVRGMATAGLLAFAAALFLISVPRGLPGVELLQSLRFHIAALAIPLAILLIWAGARWRAALVLLLAVASVGQGLLPVIDGYQRRDAVTGTVLANIKVLSFNVLTGNYRGRAAADYIISEAPDIAVVMETPGIRAYLDDIAKVLPYRVGCERPRTCDLTVFSRTPIDNPQMLLMPPFMRERLAIARTTIDGVPLTVVGAHLSKPYFDEAAWVELQNVHAVLGGIEGRVIVSGDFNAAAWSDEVANFSAASDLVPPPWHPGTWPVRFGALGVPIDNMFTRGDILIDTIDSPDDSFGSNHRALRAQISLRADSSPPQ